MSHEDEIRIEYENALKRGVLSRSMEDILDNEKYESRETVFRELLFADYEYRLKTTGSQGFNDYLTRFPEYHHLIHEVVGEVQNYSCFAKKNIGRYSIVQKLPAGGMGIVYKATHPVLQKIVAVKVIREEFLADTEAVSRFFREIRAISNLDHPNVIKALDAGEDENKHPFLVMEWVDGKNLEQFATSHFRDAPHDVFDHGHSLQVSNYMLQTAHGLRYLFTNHLVHRDIKPSNLMLTENGMIKILDLGLSKLREHGDRPGTKHTVGGTWLGTPGFIAPEQLTNAADVDIRADIYSLGCTFYYLLFGNNYDINRPPTKLPGQVPASLKAVLEKMLALHPSGRYQSPVELIVDLEKYTNSSQTVRKSKTVVYALLIAVALLAAGVLYPVSTRNRPKPDVPETSVSPVSTTGGTRDELSSIHETSSRYASQIEAAVDLRYKGDQERALEQLFKIEERLRHVPESPDRAYLLSLSKAGRADCLFFNGLASSQFQEKTLLTLLGLYDAILTTPGEKAPDFEAEMLFKSAIVSSFIPLKSASSKERVNLAKDVLVRHGLDSHEYLTALLQLAEAMSSVLEDLVPVRHFAEQFDLNTDPLQLPHKLQELRLFALEYLIHRNANKQGPLLDSYLRSLSEILLRPFNDSATACYLNRYFDLAIRSCREEDHSRLVQYILRSRPEESRRAFLPEETIIAFYFSENRESGFAIYYPKDRTLSQRFSLPWKRSQIKEAIKKDEPLELHEELVELIRRDRSQNIPIQLSWNDSMCWPRFLRDGFTNEDWPFNASITIDEILGTLK